MEKLKYIKFGTYNNIVVFPLIVEHDTFAHLNPVSAGFCYISEKKVDCFGESVSLKLKADKEADSREATKQICGVDAWLGLIGITGEKK